MAVRYLEKFTDAQGLAEYTFPLDMYELDYSQGLRTPVAEAVGLDYAVRLIGFAPSLKRTSRARIRFAAAVDGLNGYSVNDELDAAAAVQQVGLGKLWTSDGRWAWASLAEMPSYRVQFNQLGVAPVVAGFDIFSNWFGALHDVTEVISASGQQFVLNNDGPLPATSLSITIEPLSAGGFDSVEVINLSAFSDQAQVNEFQFISTRASASTLDRLRLDTQMRSAGPAVLYSDDGGLTYVDDFAEYVLPPSTQKVLSFQINPGANTIQVNNTGTPDFEIRVLYYDTYH